MASLLSFSLRRGNNPDGSNNSSSSRRTNNNTSHQQQQQQLRRRQYQQSGQNLNQSFVTAQQSPTDPWGLGIATSTSSSCDSYGLIPQRTISHDVDELRIPPIPSTPEGLRPRKSIHRIRQEVQDMMMTRSPKRMAFDPRDHIEDKGVAKNLTPYSTSLRSTVSPSPQESQSRQSPASASLQWSEHITMTDGGIPPSLDCYDRTTTPSTLAMESYKVMAPPPNSRRYASRPSPQISMTHDDSMDEEQDHDEDIISDLQSSTSNRLQGGQSLALSPNLSGGHARTAVGAVVFAMTGSSAPQEAACTTNPRSTAHNTSNQSILPPRDWMHSIDFNVPLRTEAEYQDDMAHIRIHDKGEKDEYDNESSLHASPSSNPWRRRQMQFNEDTSFTRDINTSWVRDGRDGHGALPYDFEPIWVEPDAQNRLNISAISHSLHNQHDMESLNSMASTMNDEDDCQAYGGAGDFPRFYQALTEEDVMVENEDAADKALILAKAQNQRRMKENLLLSTLERLQDVPSLLIELQDHDEARSMDTNSLYDIFYLNRLYRMVEDIILGVQTIGNGAASVPDDTTAQALRFYLSLIQLFQSKCSHDDAMIYCWRPVEGFRASIGLADSNNPSSPPAKRGGDSSQFSLPSESANDNTPHTSNVSIATTITTVLSPEQSSRFRRQGSVTEYTDIQTRQVVELISRILEQLSVASHQLLEEGGHKKTAIQDVRCAYLELLQLPIRELKHIIKSFELVPVNEASYDTTTVATMKTRSVSSKRTLEPKEMTSEMEENVGDYDDENNDSSGDEAIEAEADEHMNDNDILRVNVIQDEHENCEVEVLAPNPDDMVDTTEHERVSEVSRSNNGGYEPLIEDDDENHADGPVDNLRRTVGSFDLESLPEERDQAPEREEEIARENDRVGRIPLNFLTGSDVERPTGAFPTHQPPSRRLGAARRWSRRIFPGRRAGGRGRRQASNE